MQIHCVVWLNKNSGGCLHKSPSSCEPAVNGCGQALSNEYTGPVRPEWHNRSVTARSREGRIVADTSEIILFCNQLLRASAFQDLAVNGLQVQGKHKIERLAVAVSASEWTLRKAVGWNADALLVHHGLFHGSRMTPLTGILARRLRLLFRHDINLIAYHLPLDSHEAIGNCTLLAVNCGFTPSGRFAQFGGEPLGVVAECDPGVSIADLAAHLAQVTEREPTVVGSAQDTILRRVGFLTGSGYSALEDALVAGCQALVTGDIREPTMAEARELGIPVIAAGHEATERFGVQALAQEISAQFGVKTAYFHDPNPA